MAPEWADTAFDGVGASRAGGRWNSIGVPVVYLGSSLALSAFELLVHIDHERALQEHVAIPVDFDDDLVLRIERAILPPDWHTPHGVEYTQALGDAWVKQEASAILEVPSRTIPLESNYLINPDHPDTPRITIGERHPFRYDPRVVSSEEPEEETTEP